MLLLVPAGAFAQGTVTVAGILGPVEWKSASGAKFSTLQPSAQIVHVGDQIRTGAGGTVTLTLPDTSYMVITENSTVTIQDFWTSNYRNIVDVMMGKVRFYIQRLGGKPNPYRVQTPTALIAVRGTIFEVKPANTPWCNPAFLRSCRSR
jgi:ferric-dicitrate binding protein FerR (iron transport regulator)